MAKQNIPLLAFNRGIISPKALARVDLDKTRLSASLMTNWIPKAQGGMRIRPGTKYLGSSKNDTGAAWIDFVSSTDDTALLEMTPTTMRVWDTGDDLITRTTRVTGLSDFNADTGQWTQDTGRANGGTFGFGDTGLVLDAVNRGGLAQVTRKVALGDTGDKNKELAVKIHVTRGPVTFRCGNDTGTDTYVSETSLRTGYHDLVWTQTDTGGFHLTFQSSVDVDRIVNSISMSDTGVLSLTTPWAATDLKNMRWDQSADVVFVASSGKKQHRIERRGTGKSWSVVEYQSDNGPFTAGRTASEVNLSVGATFGNTTMTASNPFFKSSHVGALFYLFHTGYNWQFRLANSDAFTDPITVVGSEVGSAQDRTYSYSVSGTWAGRMQVLHTIGDKEDGPYGSTNRAGAVANKYILANGDYAKNSATENAANNGLTEYVKIGFPSGEHDSGAAIIDFVAVGTTKPGVEGGAEFGVVRVTDYTSSTSVGVEVLKSVPKTTGTNDWREGLWSDAQKWPTDVSLYEGRLWWFGESYVWGSVPDDYQNFDDTTEGDSKPLNRVLGSGPVDSILFSAALGRLLLGTAGSVLSLRSTQFDEPLTVSNMTAKPSTTQGAAAIRAAQVDDRAIYVHRSTTRLYELYYSPEKTDYTAQELTALNPEILASGVVSIVIQRQPDTRIHCVLGNGTVAILTYEPLEESLCWSTFETDGTVENAVVLPGTVEDKVYYHINRTIGGVTKRFLERWAQEDESEGDTGLSFLVDCAVSQTNDTGRDGLTSSIGGFAHLAGESIVGWANDTGQSNSYGKDLSPDTGDNMSRTLYYVNAASDTGDTGKIALAEDVKHFVGGLEYVPDYRSTKLAYAAEQGTALSQMKRTDKIGFVLYNTHNNGLFFGSDTGNLDPLPRTLDNGDSVDADKVFTELDEVAMPFPGLWDTDSRIHLRGKAGRPVTVLAAVPTVKTVEK